MPDPALPPHGSLPRALCLKGIHVNVPKNQVVEGGGFEPPKLARQIYSLIPLATREPLLEDIPRVKNPGSPTQGRHFIGIGWLVQSFDRDFLLDSNSAFL